jgi:M6 family metalloprotease-like protein
MSRHYLLAILLSVCTSISAQSAPLKFVPQTLVQPDGDTIHVFASGDEFYNWVHDKDNYTILRDPVSQYFVYAAVERGKLVPTSYIVGRIDPAVAGLIEGVNVFPEMSPQRSLAKKAYASLMSPTAVTGARNNLIVFIRFKDEPEFTEYANEFNLDFNYLPGSSLKSYYREVSGGRLDITSIIVQASGSGISSYQDDQPRSYYLKYDAITNPNGYGSDRASREDNLLRKALTAVLPQIPSTVDLDGDGDGRVDNVCFIVSGSPPGWSELLWPHMSYLSASPAFLINGKTVYTYNLQLEKYLSPGTVCHEMGHSLGMPDLYHYSNGSSSPCGEWDIMSSGFDVHMSNYMKYAYMKWIPTLRVITTSGTYWLNASTAATNTIYKIASPRGAREWFFVEYRRKSGQYEAFLPGSGLLVYRINEKVAGNAYGPPDEIYVYRPNGTLTSSGNTGNAFFSSDVKRTAINDVTNPSSFLSDGLAGGLSISNIGSAVGDSIRFDVTILSAADVQVKNDYAASKTTFTWTDIAKTGTEIHNWVNASANPDATLDDGYTDTAIPLGFDFSYYGQKFDSLYVGINGLVSFTQKALNVGSYGVPSTTDVGSFSRNILWPGNSTFLNSIAVAYQDFDLNRKDGYGGGGVFYKTDGDQFILSWINVGSFGQRGDTTNSFQLVLDKTTNNITINFQKFGLESIRQIVKVGMEKDITQGLEWIQSGDYPDHIPANGSSVTFSPSTATSAGIPGHQPVSYALKQNYPNPFNPSTTISFSLPSRSFVSLKIFDVLGKNVATIVEEELSAGSYQRRWDASRYPSGMYFYRLKAGAFTETKKLLLLR